MLNYQNLIEIASAITEAGDIVKEGLTLQYELGEKNHKKLDEDLFYRTNQNGGGEFSHQEIIEVSIGIVNFKIIKKKLK